MIALLTILIIALISGMYPMADSLMNNMLSTSLSLNSYLITFIHLDILGQIRETMFMIGGAMLILRFLVKGTNVYGLWRDGDPDANPLQYTINFIYAIGAMIVFPFLYEYFIGIANDLLNKILINVSKGGGPNYLEQLTSLAEGHIFTAIAILICWAMVMVLYIKIVMRGFEMIILQAGFPLACIGLLDNDKGIFKNYCMQIIKAIITTIVQIFLAKVAFFIIFSAPATMVVFSCMWSIACMSTALATPKILSEFMVPTGGGGGSIMNTAYSATRMVSMAKHVFVK